MDKYQRKPKRADQALILIAAICLVLLGSFRSLPAAADPPIARLMDSEPSALNLSAAQQQKLTALESASRAQAGLLISQIGQIRGKLSEIYRNYDFDVTDARKMNQDLNRVQGQLLDLRLSEQQQLRKILSPDQFAQLQTALHQHGFPGARHRPDPDSRHSFH